MESNFKDSELLRLATLNHSIALAKDIGFNHSETAKSITVIIERENGETVTEYLSGAEIKEAVAQRIANFNKVKGGCL